jgi:putative DNA primase/helicase
VIWAFDHERPRAMREGLAALVAAGTPVFRQETRMVQVGDIPLKDERGKTLYRPGVEEVEPAVLECLLADAAEWRTRTHRGLVKPCAPPREVLAMLLKKHDEWGDAVPALRGVATTPLLRPDGSLLTAPGYDPASGLFLFRPPKLPPIPDRPSRDDAYAALQVLAGLLSEFPFADDDSVSHAVALAALLTGVQRPMLPGAPFFLANKPAPGSGGTYLCELIGALATGKKPAPMTWSGGAEEPEKRLDGMLLAKHPVILIDNIVGQLRGEKFCIAGSAPRVTIRLMGGQKILEIDTTVLMLGSGNNVLISDDEVRRILMMTIDTGMPDPSIRQFQRNPVADVMRNRGHYVAAALTVLRAFLVAGRPGLLPPRAGYEVWSDQVRSALVWLGCADPCLSTDRLRAQDPVVMRREALFTAWRDELHGKAMTQKELVDAVSKGGIIGGYGSFSGFGSNYDYLAWREAVLDVAASRRDPQMLDRGKFNWWLRKNENSVAAGHKLVIDRITTPARPLYRLDPV